MRRHLQHLRQVPSRGWTGGAIAVTLVAAVMSLFAAPNTDRYDITVLVANRAGLAPGALIDPRLVNPWGIALRPPGAGGHFWISNAGTLSSSTYIGDVKGAPLRQDGLTVVDLDGPLLSYEDGIANVTGQVYNAASDWPGQPVEFPVSGAAVNLSTGTPVPIGTVSGSAKFVFVTTDGTINAWRASTAESMTSAIIVKDYSDHGRDQIRGLSSLPAFTGVAMSAYAGAMNRLYVTDFQNGIIRVLDNRWNDITARVPFDRPAGMPTEFSPYNIQYLDGLLYVTFAVLDTSADEAAADLPAPGAGHVVAYDLNGRVVRQFADIGRLNSPWGLAIAPANFGALSGALLVGNFGDGTIAGFDVATGNFRGYMRGPDVKPLTIDGLWGLAFGNGVSLGDADSLYFTAGPNGEQDGIFGRIRALRD
jgi:uncharacterized protein (TIGR03118 family)